MTRALGMDIGGEREYGVGMFFFPQEELRRNQAKKMFEIIVEKKEWNSSAGVKCLPSPMCWDIRP